MPETKFVDEEELAGKTIAKVVAKNSNIWFLFTDGTYTGIGIDHGYYAGDTELCWEGAEYTDDLLLVGLTTQEEVDAKEKAKREHEQKCADAEELQRYLELKRKFEAKSSPRPSSPATAPPSP